MCLRVRWLRLCVRWRRQVNLHFMGIRWFSSQNNPNKKTQALPFVGIRHYTFSNGDQKKRVHLRIDQDGHGIMVINASRIFHFNSTATYMASLTLEKLQSDEVVHQITKIFSVSKNQAKFDYESFLSQFLPLIDPASDACPICDLYLDSQMPFSNKLSAPYRMDLALTYRCNNDCGHCYNQKGRAPKEFTTDQWKEVLKKIWEIGIPHVVFTGGEPTLRKDLPDLIAYAEGLGLITGINTNGRYLKNKDYLLLLVKSGLDHVQITLESADEAIHDNIVGADGAWRDTTEGLRNAINSKLFVMTNTTMLRENSPGLEALLKFTAEIGVPTVGLNGLIRSGRGKNYDKSLDANELPDLLRLASELTKAQCQRLIWYTPTQYCRFDPLAHDLGVKGCSAALYNMCIDPDGMVLPCQSYYTPLGNLLTDDWKNIWEHDLAVSIRERRYAPSACHDCSVFSTCGSGCPLEICNNQDVSPRKMLGI